MNTPKFINSISFESVGSSIQNLMKCWQRRQKWKIFLNHSSAEEEEEESQSNNRAAWRNNLTKFIESKPVHFIAILLLFMDLILTVFELSSSLSCKPEKRDYRIKKVWYHWLGIGILSLLSLKAVALGIGLGLRSFFKRPGYVFDGVVAIMALFLEAFLEKKGGGLLVMVSLWRVVRVVESAFELSDEAIEAQIEGINCQFQLLRGENTRLLGSLAEKDIVIAKLQDIIQQQCNDHSSLDTNSLAISSA